MFEQQNLIPNLNEMMEEYVGINGEEATPKLQNLAIQDEMAKTRTEIEQQLEESRKRKRDAEESETEQGGDVEIDDLVSKRAHVGLEQTLM